MKYLSLTEVIAIHETMLTIGGGADGILNLNLLISAIERSKSTFNGQELYPDLFMKASALIHSLIKNHPFVDGNKRTGYFSAARFLFLNGYELNAKEKEILDFVLSIEKGTTLKSIALWLRKH